MSVKSTQVVGGVSPAILTSSYLNHHISLKSSLYCLENTNSLMGEISIEYHRLGTHRFNLLCYINFQERVEFEVSQMFLLL